MNPLNVVVPFSVFTEYRDRRSRARDAGGLAITATPVVDAAAASHDARDGVDTAPASRDTKDETTHVTTMVAKPTTERIPS
jgi:hypothetical protein